jgi:hypothetical protein
MILFDVDFVTKKGKERSLTIGLQVRIKSYRMRETDSFRMTINRNNNVGFRGLELFLQQHCYFDFELMFLFQIK